MGIKRNIYLTSALEDWVTSFYMQLRILYPRQIKIEHIARMNDIFIHDKPIPAFHEVIGRYRGITLDKR
jgi:hypothetical protein